MSSPVLAALVLALSGVSASAQNTCPAPYDGTPCIKDWPTAPKTKTAKSGTLECTIWKDSPALGSVQVACCNTTCAGVYSGALVKNEILDMTVQFVAGTVLMPGAGVVSWLLGQQAGSPGILSFQFSVMPYPTGTAVLETGVF